MKGNRRVDPGVIWLAAMLLLALGLRVYRLDAQSLWYDEAVTAQVAGQGISELTRWTADDIQPPLYYYVVAGWTRLAGRSEWALRLPSAFFGVLTVALLWAVARRLFGRGETGRWAAGIAALLAAPLPLYVYYAQEARMYTLLTFLGVLAGYALLRTGVRGQGSGVWSQESGGRRQAAGGRGQHENTAEHPERSGRAVPATQSKGAERSSAWAPHPSTAQRGRMRCSAQDAQSSFAGQASQGDQRDPSLALSCHLCWLVDPLRVTDEAIFRTGRLQIFGAKSATWWIVFVLASVAMLYTHYFGVFLLLAYGLCWLVFHAGHAARKGSTKAHEGTPRPDIRVSSCLFVDKTAFRALVRRFAAFGLATAAIILLYLPWLPAMLNRYRVDASYWQGALKLSEALRHVAINFTVAAPEMMLEGVAARLLPVFGAAFALALIALFWRDRHAGKAGILLAVLVLPVIAVLLLASRTPKFNPRYLMLASPAYLLLLAGGVGAWAQWNGAIANRRINESANGASRTTHHASSRSIPLGRITHHREASLWDASRITLAFVLTAALLIPSFISLRNWFTDPAFTKAQWRELTAFVRAERGPDEAVLLVSGHAYPAWDYYAADIPVTRLPAGDILNVNAVLGFEVGPALTQALTGKRGAWLVAWQDEVVDPVGFVPYFLDRGGQEQPVARQFWHLGLRHWRLAPGATFPAEPRPQHLDGANFDHKLALLGWDDPADGMITVYWRVLNTLTQDYQVSAVVEDLAGNRIGQWDGRPAGYDYPTFRWQPGQVLFGRYPLRLPATAAPGNYILTLTVYDPADLSGLDIRDVADNPAGKQVRLGPVQVK